MESTRPQYHTPLAPFDQLDPFRQQRIRHIKSVFSAQETDLRLHLARLSLSELADRLSWIPPELLRDIQQVGRGRFAAVCSAKIKYPTEDRFWENELHGNMFVLKEVEEKMLRELVLSIQLSNMIDTTAPTAVLFGLTYILRTKRYALVMEYSPLGTMEQQPLATTWKDVMEQAFRISANLDKMHRAGVVHGDLHPANIVFSSQRPMIVGVGLSRAVTDRRAVAYRPPEAVEGADGTKAADVYCLGTLLWQMVTGVPPRRETKCGDSIPGAAPEYNDIIQRCWDKDPSARPSAEDVAGFTSFWLYRCKHKDDESPFLPETRAFVAERRAVHLEQSEADGFGSLTSRL